MPTNYDCYEIPAEELINTIMDLSASAGPGLSGAVIDTSVGHKLREIHHLKGCLLALIDGVKPEQRGGIKVSRSDGRDVSPYNLRGEYAYKDTRRLGMGELTIHEVWYVNKEWYFEFKEHRSDEYSAILFKAEYFKALIEA